MNTSVVGGLATLLRARTVAALGTLQSGEPYVSMVPMALASDGRAIIVHVSRLAAHTQNMLQDERVSVLVMDTEGPGKPPQALARVTVQGRARHVGPDEPGYRGARQAYLERFPDTAELFQFADFSVFLIEVHTARYVGGFAQAVTLTLEAFARAAAALDAGDV